MKLINEKIYFISNLGSKNLSEPSNKIFMLQFRINEFGLDLVVDSNKEESTTNTPNSSRRNSDDRPKSPSPPPTPDSPDTPDTPGTPGTTGKLPSLLL